jgi:hypothetical protein
LKNLKSKRAGWAVLLTVATAAVAATVFVATGAAGKSTLTYVNVGAAAFVQESSVCSTDGGIVGAPTSNLKARLARPLRRDYTHGGYSGELVTDACTYEAHIDLPDGMKIGNITAYYNNTGGDATFHFEANDDAGDHVDIVDDGGLDGIAGEEGGAVCDGSANCHAIWDRTGPVSNTSTHYGIHLVADAGFILYRFKIKVKSS